MPVAQNVVELTSSPEALIERAAEALTPPVMEDDLLGRAEELADGTLRLMRRERMGTLHASVTLAITDIRLRLAYLETMGSRMVA